MPSPAERPVSAGRIRHTLGTLTFATAICGVMLLVRSACAADHHFRFSGLFGNLLLAWIPLVLSLLIRQVPAGGNRPWFWSALILWFLFFPNSFYIITDLVHMKKFGRDGIYPWFDLLITAAFACGGMFLGSLSLYLLQLSVRRNFGWRAGWAFAGGMLALGSVGIYLGRFLRLNSWDVLTRPFKLAGGVAGLFGPARLTEVAAFSATFFFFSLAVYCFVVSMARLHEEPPRNGPERASSPVV